MARTAQLETAKILRCKKTCDAKRGERCKSLGLQYLEYPRYFRKRVRFLARSSLGGRGPSGGLASRARRANARAHAHEHTHERAGREVRRAHSHAYTHAYCACYCQWRSSSALPQASLLYQLGGTGVADTGKLQEQRVVWTRGGEPEALH